MKNRYLICYGIELIFWCFKIYFRLLIKESFYCEYYFYFSLEGCVVFSLWLLSRLRFFKKIYFIYLNYWYEVYF